MNKSNINEQPAQTEADSNSTAQNQQVSQTNANTNVSSRFKWKSISYCGEEPYTDTPPWVEIKNTSEDVNGNKIVTVWNKNKTPKIQSFYNGVLVHSCNRDAKEFGRDFFSSYGWHQEMIHREAESIVENGC